jgi:hypothetical protein
VLTMVPVCTRCVALLALAMAAAAAAPAQGLSLRASLLQHLIERPDGKRECTLTGCDSTVFAAGSDSATWKKHFASYHPDKLKPLVDAQKRKAVDDDASVTEASVLTASSGSSSGKKARLAFDQPTLAEVLQIQRGPAVLGALAVAFADNSIAYAVVETASFRNLLSTLGWRGSFPSRESLRAAVLDRGQAVRTNIAALLKNAVVTLAADGWTNVRQQKVTNVVLMVHGKAYYWCSIINNAENTAVWLAQQLLPLIHSLINDHTARVLGFVVDNESVNKATHRILARSLPFLIHVPCAAHTIQLIVRSCLVLPELAPIVAQLCSLIQFFNAKENRIALRRIQEAREVKTLAVLKTCDTRWHALLMAAERMLKIQKEVKTCYDEETLPAVGASFFEQLPVLISFLQPFMHATDAVQRDSATLYTVWQQFSKLRVHAEQYPWALPAINTRWEHRIHVDAVTAVALLSFAQFPASAQFNRRNAQSFIVTMGSSYIRQYHLAPHPDETEEESADALLLQIAEFNGRSGLFSCLESEIAAVKRRAGVEEWQPLNVWRLYPGVQLAEVAIALLSITASEAAVERSFSAQALVHAKRRNCLHNDAVEAEMMVKFNGGNDASQLSVIEMEVEGFSKDSEDAATAVPEAPEADEQLLEAFDDATLVEESDEEMRDAPPAAAAAAPSAGARQRALRRQPSIHFECMDRFLQWFIEEHALQSTSRINADITLALERHSSKLHESPGTATLLMELRKVWKQIVVSQEP